MPRATTAGTVEPTLRVARFLALRAGTACAPSARSAALFFASMERYSRVEEAFALPLPAFAVVTDTVSFAPGATVAAAGLSADTRRLGFAAACDVAGRHSTRSTTPSLSVMRAS